MNNQIKSDVWVSYRNEQVPRSRINKSEILLEKKVSSLFNDAIRASDILDNLRAKCDNYFEQIMIQKAKEDGAEYNPDKSFTAYLFDRSVKIEREVAKQTGFNDQLVKQSYDLFVQYLTDENAPEFIKKMVQDAFRNTKGSLDKNKIGTLLSYEDDSNVSDNDIFQSAIALLKEARNVSDTKVYYRFYMGKYPEYELINLNITNT